MKGFKILLIIMLMIASFSANSFADTEFPLGKETKGIEIKIDDDTKFNIRIRMQPRFDIGETSTSLKADDGKSYSSISDMYLRRVRWEIGGNLTKNFKFGAEFEADKTSKQDSTASVSAYHIFGDYKFSDEFNLLFGKKKLPYSRVSLTSSSKQLIIERPTVTEDAKKFFNDTHGHGYFGPQIMLHGKVAEGMFKYNLSITDGWQAGQTTKWTSKTVEKSGLAYIGMVEISPPGWIEESQSDAHLGEGRHLTLSGYYGAQSGIEYGPTKTSTSTANLTTGVVTTTTTSTANDNKEDRTLTGFDLSFHLGGLIIQGEYVSMEITPSTAGTKAVKPNGYYLQAGYYISGTALEPAIRYEYYNKDSNKTDDNQTTSTIGFNWYPKGHSFKVSANYVVTTFGKGNSSKLAEDDNLSSIQIQSQIYF
ncbi:MAG: porin [Nitrospinota bacterium]